MSVSTGGRWDAVTPLGLAVAAEVGMRQLRDGLASVPGAAWRIAKRIGTKPRRYRKLRREREAVEALRAFRRGLAPPREDLTDPNLPKVPAEPVEKPATIAPEPPAEPAWPEHWATEPTRLLPVVRRPDEPYKAKHSAPDKKVVAANGSTNPRGAGRPTRSETARVGQNHARRSAQRAGVRAGA